MTLRRRLGKRIFDLFFTMLGLPVTAPILLVSALLIWVEDGRPIFFRQKRVGHKGKPFHIWKFRTMVVDAEKKGGAITVGHDPRITRVGYWLRKFKVDEFPQLINVLKGEMSLIGPRPEVEKYVNLYTEAQRQVLELVPGITDPASIKYANESDVLAQASDPEKMYIEEIMPEKIRLNLEYARHANCFTDFIVLLRTILRVFGSRSSAS
jgi:lipopolysaccharide/colanic/teichoic acid biosynthesis glycosyltransferase